MGEYYGNVCLIASTKCLLLCTIRDMGRPAYTEHQLLSSLKLRLNAKTTRSDTGCWLWTGARFKSGYGAIGLGCKRVITTHRAAWWLHTQQEPVGVVMHSCDIRHCINPAHLLLGTQKKNLQDMIRRGRGRGQIVAALTKPQRDDIRLRRGAGERGSDLAKEYGITQQQVCSYYKNRVN